MNIGEMLKIITTCFNIIITHFFSVVLAYHLVEHINQKIVSDNGVVLRDFFIFYFLPRVLEVY